MNLKNNMYKTNGAQQNTAVIGYYRYQMPGQYLLETENDTDKMLWLNRARLDITKARHGVDNKLHLAYLRKSGKSYRSPATILNFSSREN